MPKFLANIDMEQNRIVDLPTPAAADEAVNKAYVDAIAQGVDAKASVRVVSALGNINIATPGTTIDTVTLNNGDRILLALQSTTSQNGIWVFNGAASALTRPADADSSGDLSPGTYVFVEEGGLYSDSGWVINSDTSPIIPGTTGHSWTQFTGAGSIVAGAGLAKTGNTIDIGTGSGISVLTDTIAVDSTVARRNATNTFDSPQVVDLGGAGVPLSLDLHTSGGNYLAFTEQGVARGSIRDLADALVFEAAGVAQITAGGDIELLPGGNIDCNAKRLLDVAVATAGTDGLSRNAADARYPRKTSVNCAAALTTVVNHGFNTRDVLVNVIRSTSPWDEVEADIEATDANNVTVRFAIAPAASAYRINVMA